MQHQASAEAAGCHGSTVALRVHNDYLSQSAMKEASPKTPVAQPLPYVPGHTRAWNDSWQALYSGWSEVIVAFSVRQGLNQQSAQNVCQESMITLLRSHHGQMAGHDSRQGSFEAWFWGVVRNRVKAERRRHNKEILIAPSQPCRDGHYTDAPPFTSQQPVDCAEIETQQERQALWVAALQRLRQRGNPENFEIYTALLAQSSAPEALARKYAKTVNNIYAIKHRSDDLLLKEARSIRKNQRHFPLDPTFKPHD
jgi:DNA-directed RNA polymerase specialized sigma24 family protein